MTFHLYSIFTAHRALLHDICVVYTFPYVNYAETEAWGLRVL